jgi:methyl-accepting chemotaxis protein
MKNLSMGFKMSIGFGGILILLGVVVGIFYKALQDTQTNYMHMQDVQTTIALKAGKINEKMLQARRNEKDFIMRKDMKYLERNKATTDEIAHLANEVASIAKINDMYVIEEEAISIGTLSAEYYTVFEGVVNGNVTMGLDPSSGFQGNFRSAAHDLGEAFDRFDAESFQVLYLFLRRWEKDFMRNGTEKYQDRLFGTLDTYATMLEESGQDEELKLVQMEAINGYKEVFEKIVALGYDSEEAATEYQQIRDLAHVLEDTINSILIPNSRALLLTARKHEKDFLMRNDKKYVGRLSDVVEELRAGVSSDSIEEVNREFLTGLLDRYESDFLALVAQNDEVVAKIAKMRDIVHQIEPAVEEIELNATKAQEETLMTTAKSVARSIQISIAVAAGAGIIAVILGLLITFSVTGPLRKGVTFAQTVADGDLTQQAEIDQKDEIGVLAGALNGMATNLRGIMGDISSDSNTVASSSEEMTTSATDMSECAEGMTNMATTAAEATEQATSNIKNVAAGIEEVSANSTTVASAAEEVSTNLSTVGSAVEQMSANMNTIAVNSEDMSSSVTTVASAVEEMSISLNEVSNRTGEAVTIANNASTMADDTSRKVNTLGESAKEIDKVVDIITGIAAQTNLLALNATIEAASAGEAGKGFAVVANEVKELAKQTASATDDIREQVESMQSNSGEAVDAIGNIVTIIGEVNDVFGTIAASVQQQTSTVNSISENVASTAEGATVVSRSVQEVALGAQEISKNVQEATVGVNGIAQNMAELATGTNEIARNAGQAAEGMNEVAENVENVKSAAQETKSGATGMKDASGELAGLASSLQESVKQFRV